MTTTQSIGKTYDPPSTTARESRMTDTNLANLVSRWESAQERVETAKRELSRAQTDAKNAANALGKFLYPSDATPPEKLSVWHGDRILEVSLPIERRMEEDGKHVEEVSRNYLVAYRSNGKRYGL
jgi:hypothetical protein